VRDGSIRELRLPDDAVFEDRAQRIVDLNAQAQPPARAFFGGSQNR